MEINGLVATLVNFTSLSILIALLFISSFIYKTMMNKNLAFLPPGPKPWPIVGSLFQMLSNRPTFRWIHKLMDDFNTEIMCIRIGNVHVITVTSPELAREFLKTNDPIFASRPCSMAADLTSNGYLSAALTPFADQWKKMKRIVSTEVLSPARHRWLQNKRDEESDHLVQYLCKQCMSATDGLVNLRTVTRHYCGNVIRRIIFNRRFFGTGTENGGPGAEEEEHVSALFTILSYLYAFCASDYMPWLRRFDIDGHEKIIQKAIDSVVKYQDPIIDERIQIWKDGLKNKPEDILDVLITLNDRGQTLLTTAEIKAQIIELMIATVDNPSNGIEWAFAEMLNQPQLLEKAWDELDMVVGRERLVQESDLNKLNFIKACAKEAFRLHPIAPFNVPHVSISDANVGGYFIPKGSHILLSRPGLGRNPRVWDESLKFKPERHLNDNGGPEVGLADPELRMLSFSTGRRGCAGVLLGSTMTTMLLARLLQGFTWSLPPGVSSVELKENKCDLLLANPLYAVAKPRLPENVYPIA